jgi:hypothetical protein
MKKALLLAFLSSFAIQFILVDAKYVTDSANVISNEAELERAIDDFYMYSDVIMMVETVNNVSDIHEYARARFFESDLDEKGTENLNLLFVYSNASNEMTVAHGEKCSLSFSEIAGSFSAKSTVDAKIRNIGNLLLDAINSLKEKIAKKVKNPFCQFEARMDFMVDPVIFEPPSQNKPLGRNLNRNLNPYQDGIVTVYDPLICFMSDVPENVKKVQYKIEQGGSTMLSGDAECNKGFCEVRFFGESKRGKTISCTMSYTPDGISGQNDMTGTITSVSESGNKISIDIGSKDGVKVGSTGLVYYNIRIRDEDKPFYLAKFTVIKVDENSALSEIIEKTKEIKEGYFIKIEAKKTSFSKQLTVADSAFIFYPVNQNTLGDAKKEYEYFLKISQANSKPENSIKPIYLDIPVKVEYPQKDKKDSNSIYKSINDVINRYRSDVSKDIFIAVTKDVEDIPFEFKIAGFARRNSYFIVLNGADKETLAHEAGHSMSGLCDEYKQYLWEQQNSYTKCPNPYPECCTYIPYESDSCLVMSIDQNYCSGMPYLDANTPSPKSPTNANYFSIMGSKYLSEFYTFKGIVIFPRLWGNPENIYPIEATCPLRNCG